MKSKDYSGISLNKLMKRFGHDSFVSTQSNHAKNSGNIDPRKAYMQQAHVQLTGQAAAWLNTELEHGLRRYGQISEASLSKLDWPD